MSFVSTASTLNIGDLSSNTVNIINATNLNLGTTNLLRHVLIKGIRMPFGTKYYSSNFPCGSTNSSTNDTDCYCLLPYGDIEYLMIRWGFRKDPGDNNDTTVTFDKEPLVSSATAFNGIPYVFVTKFDGGDGYALVKSISTTNFVCNSAKNSSNKAAINWLAIGTIYINEVKTT